MAFDCPKIKIESSDVLLRRVPSDPRFTQPDEEDETVTRVSPAALRFDSDGMSVHCADCVEAKGVPLEQTYSHIDPKLGVVSFRASVPIGEGARVIPEPDPDDTRIGEAHALVLGSSTPIPTTEQKKDIRAAIAAAASWVKLPEAHYPYQQEALG